MIAWPTATPGVTLWRVGVESSGGAKAHASALRTARSHYATPGKAFLSFTFSLAMSSGDIVMPVSASRWATELSSISLKDSGPLLAFAVASRAAAAFAPVASSIAACFAVACDALPARQH